MKVRRAVLGDAHVDRAEAAKTAFDAPFQEMITEGAWGTVWAREGLSRRDRSLVTLALLAALGHSDEVARLRPVFADRALRRVQAGRTAAKPPAAAAPGKEGRPAHTQLRILGHSRGLHPWAQRA